MAKIDLVSLIIVRFSSRNHRWKAENLSLFLNLSDMTLLERPVPLLGRLRYPIKGAPNIVSRVRSFNPGSGLNMLLTRVKHVLG